jgi:SAM-dependent methyltransferase
VVLRQGHRAAPVVGLCRTPGRAHSRGRLGAGCANGRRRGLRLGAEAAERAAATADLAATESWHPNAVLARERLSPFGSSVLEVADDAPLPFPNSSFEMVVSRHPVTTVWPEIARVLRPGGTYLSQQVGAGSNRELTEFLMGPQPLSDARSTERAVSLADSAGLTVVDLRHESLLVEFNDIGAVVHFLRKVLWTVPGFTVAAYRDQLADLHAQIQRDGPFVSHAQRFLVEAHKP